MLDGLGKLTDIGSWYLGGAMVDDVTTATSTSSSAGSTSSPKSSAAGLGRGGFEILGSVVITAALTLGLLLN